MESQRIYKEGLGSVGLLVVVVVALAVAGGTVLVLDDSVREGGIEVASVLGVLGVNTTSEEDGECLNPEDAPVVGELCILTTVYGKGKDKDCILEYELECDAGPPDHVTTTTNNIDSDNNSGGGSARSAERRAEAKAKKVLQEREDRRENLMESVPDRLWSTLDRFLMKMETSVDKLDKLATRLDLRISKFEALHKEADLSGAEEYLENATALINEARGMLAEAWLVVDSLKGAETTELKISLQELKVIFSETNSIITETRVQLINSIKDARANVPLDTGE